MRVQTKVRYNINRINESINASTSVNTSINMSINTRCMSMDVNVKIKCKT
ncbi:hypothetical protein HanPSC8_Chr05g0214311 [Helianthus annuus]|nr:hypothetical protein HanPSC8_Chr05g0214311 [Helianthus annuus]